VNAAAATVHAMYGQLTMTREDKTKRLLRRLAAKPGAIHIPSAEGRGVGTTVAGADDAKQLARESAERALRLASRR
jgi:hypothetical protein